MSEWYYSDAQRLQHGPVDEAAMAALHAQGALAPDTLVWRDGMAEWRPWREVMHEAIGAPAPAETVADTPSETVATDTAPTLFEPDPFAGDAQTAGNDDARRASRAADASPYAPPTAAIADTRAPVPHDRVVHAGFWKRFAAAFIDNFILTILNYAILIPVFAVLGFSASRAGAGQSNPFESGAGMVAIFAMYPLMLLMPCIYFAWMQSSSMQASLGKLAVGIKLTRGDGSRVTFWRAFLRTLANTLVSGLTCGIGLLASAIMSGTTERKQAVHDMMCDTLVVDKHAFTADHALQREALGTATTVVLVLAGLFIVGAIALYAVMIAMIAGGSLH